MLCHSVEQLEEGIHQASKLRPAVGTSIHRSLRTQGGGRVELRNRDARRIRRRQVDIVAFRHPLPRLSGSGLLSYRTSFLPGLRCVNGRSLRSHCYSGSG